MNIQSVIAKINLIIFVAALLSFLCILPSGMSMDLGHDMTNGFEQACINIHSNLSSQLGQINSVSKVPLILLFSFILIYLFDDKVIFSTLQKRERLTEQIYFSYYKFIHWLSLLEKRSELSIA